MEMDRAQGSSASEEPSHTFQRSCVMKDRERDYQGGQPNLSCKREPRGTGGQYQHFEHETDHAGHSDGRATGATRIVWHVEDSPYDRADRGKHNRREP